VAPRLIEFQRTYPGLLVDLKLRDAFGGRAAAGGRRLDPARAAAIGGPQGD